jgi:excinuclease ABC subunit C
MTKDPHPLRGERLEALVENLPQRSGVYLMKDLAGRIIYIGKAKNLRARVRSYFRASGDNRPFVSWLDAVLGEIEVLLTPSEKDALILERELIMAHQPRYNIDLRDAKNFLCIRLGFPHQFPRLFFDRKRPLAPTAVQGDRGSTHKTDNEGSWFGPYTSAAAARETFRFIQRYFQLRVCNDRVFTGRDRPCLQHQIGHCLGPCSLPVEVDLYAQRVTQAIQFLRGRLDELVEVLELDMKAAALELRYEDAARLRDRLRAVRVTLERQQMIDYSEQDLDVVALAREGACGMLLLLQLRRGRWLSTVRVPFADTEAPSDDLIRQFLTQHYGSGAEVPPLVLLPPEARTPGEEDENLEALSDWLTEFHGTRVRVNVPQRGRGAELIKLASDNAREAHRTRVATSAVLSERLQRLQVKLGLSILPRRIECIDISTHGGAFSVGSLVVLQDGEPYPAGYRRYKIREAAPDSDVDMMREVVTRRLRQVTAGTEPGPDLLLLDGGPGQLRVIERLLADLGITDVALAALAKGGPGAGRHKTTKERVYVPGRKNPILLNPHSDELFLLSRVRDEAHRFALSYHRTLRKRSALRSVLDEVPGVGPVIRKRLLKHFGSLKAVRQATADELTAVPGISRSVAERIVALLSQVHP